MLSNLPFTNLTNLYDLKLKGEKKPICSKTYNKYTNKPIALKSFRAIANYIPQKKPQSGLFIF